MTSSDWVERAFALEHELGEQVDWFDRLTQPPQVSTIRRLTSEELAVRDCHRSAAVLALAWGVAPQTILFALAGLAPDEREWGRLVSKSWDGLSSSQRATLNALATEEEEEGRRAA